MNATATAQPDYDKELQMFRRPIAAPRMTHLGFYRWLAERDGRALSAPSGEAAGDPPKDTRMGPKVLPPTRDISTPQAPELGRDLHTHRPNCCPSCAVEFYRDDEDEGKVPA